VLSVVRHTWYLSKLPAFDVNPSEFQDPSR
jgi:hypothetical protein